MKLNELNKLGLNDFDMGDAVYDYIVHFVYEDKDLSQPYNKCMRLIASKLDVKKLQKDCVVCDIYEFIRENFDVLKNYVNKWFRAQWHIDSNIDFAQYENDEGLDFILDDVLKPIFNGDVNDGAYSWLIINLI